MTNDAQVEAARRAAKAFAKRTRRGNWREYLGWAWIGVKRAIDSGHPDTAVATGYFGVIDGLRKENRRLIIRPVVGALKYEPLAQPDEPDEYARRLDVWNETKSLRTVVTLRARVIVFLYAVEGWSQVEIAKCLGVGPSNVKAHVARLVTLVKKQDKRKETT